MQIYLLRHGHAEDGKPGRPDSERALTGEGREKLDKVLALARKAGVQPETMLTSPYRRAVETAEIAAVRLAYKGTIVRVPALAPDSSPYDVWEEIRRRQTEDSILLAGHEPLMSSLAAFLLGCPALQVDVKKAGLIRIDIERFPQEPRGILKWMLAPAVAP